ncbi:MAG: M48 family metallopeptidase [Bacteroidota bacterium]
MKKIALTIIIATTVFIACHKNAITGRRSANLMPEKDLIGLSLTEYDKFLSEHKPLPATDPKTMMVRNVGTKIQKSVEKYYSDKGLSEQLEGFQWSFNVVDEAPVNAWCMPGGKVVVYSGLLPVTQDEASLAVVMGHEIAHAVARHGNERMTQGMIVQFGAAALSIALQQNSALTQTLFQQAYGLSTSLGALKYSRTHETEADKMGLVFAAMGGYNPEAAISFWQRMSQAGSGQNPPEFLSTHPSDETRINNLKGFMPEAKKYYTPAK